MRFDNPEDEQTDLDTTSTSGPVIPARSAVEGTSSLALRAGVDEIFAAGGEGDFWLAAGEGDKPAIAPAWLWAGLALGWAPWADRGARSWRRRGLRNEEALR
jgi:hypothetical protein